MLFHHIDIKVHIKPIIHIPITKPTRIIQFIVVKLIYSTLSDIFVTTSVRLTTRARLTPQRTPYFTLQTRPKNQHNSRPSLSVSRSLSLSLEHKNFDNHSHVRAADKKSSAESSLYPCQAKYTTLCPRTRNPSRHTGRIIKIP